MSSDRDGGGGPCQRAELLGKLRALRAKVRAQNRDLTEEQAEEIAAEVRRLTFERMVAEGKIQYSED